MVPPQPLSVRRRGKHHKIRGAQTGLRVSPAKGGPAAEQLTVAWRNLSTLLALTPQSRIARVSRTVNIRETSLPVTPSSPRRNLHRHHPAPEGDQAHPASKELGERPTFRPAPRNIITDRLPDISEAKFPTGTRPSGMPNLGWAGSWEALPNSSYLPVSVPPLPSLLWGSQVQPSPLDSQIRCPIRSRKEPPVQ